MTTISFKNTPFDDYHFSPTPNMNTSSPIVQKRVGRLPCEQDKGLLVALCPGTIKLSVGKQMILTGYSCFVLEKNIPLEERAKAFPQRLAAGVAKDLTIVTTKACLQYSAKVALSEEMYSKLCKDVTASATRKYARTQSKFDSSLQVFVTGVYAGILSHSAIFIVSTAVAAFTEPPAKYAELKKDYLCKMIGSIGLGAIGGAIGTLISPGRGTFIGGLLGDSILYLF
eukprot:Nk52_evm54s2309 gene=Nk52_evmTU54s2309